MEAKNIDYELEYSSEVNGRRWGVQRGKGRVQKETRGGIEVVSVTQQVVLG